MKKKQILVCGTGFGKIYLKAIAESKEYELMGRTYRLHSM